MTEHVLLLVGSPKGPDRSQSGRLGRIVTDDLEQRGWSSKTIHLHEAVQTREGTDDLLQAVDRADIVLFAAPLYVDSLPAPAIRALQRIAEDRAAQPSTKVPRFVSIMNCGFVEPAQNDTCQRILQQFAQKACFEWIGGISLGSGGRVTRRIRQAFGLLSEAVHEEILVPEAVETMTRKPLLPSRIYVIGGNLMWKRIARKNEVLGRIRTAPYRRP